MKKIIPVTICFLIASLSLSSCGKEKAEDTARQQAEGACRSQPDRGYDYERDLRDD